MEMFGKRYQVSVTFFTVKNVDNVSIYGANRLFGEPDIFLVQKISESCRSGYAE